MSFYRGLLWGLIVSAFLWGGAYLIVRTVLHFT